MTVKLTPYITLEGRTQEAIQFYAQTMGAEVLSILTYGDMPDLPDTFPDEVRSLVAHAKVQVGGTELMFSDTPGGTPVESGKRVTICITTDSVEESRRIFDALQEGGQVNMPFREEPFSPGFGDLTDKYGVTFQIYTELG
ncbi:VOC family protein [Paenibacillus sp. FSL P4-0338]|uniref:VOC family protein n=1 Tax=unclassified Paenibacillus TaxID=185978 RepID=UPI0003E2297E|nr:VOC family protein [Paenibacillus sp. FSL R7-269]ETT54606.1 3-demethylubiquinone-9 3-methyltransferase [Paenibacillus sp. FSL R7-269]